MLLGYELDPFNDSITAEEKEVRDRRKAIEDELLNEDDSFNKYAKEHEFN